MTNADNLTNRINNLESRLRIGKYYCDCCPNEEPIQMKNAENLSQVTPIPSAEENAVSLLKKLSLDNARLRSEIAGLKAKIELMEWKKL